MDVTTDESDQKKNLSVIEAGALMRLIGDGSTEDNEDKETKECKVLFKDCIFFLSREVNASLMYLASFFKNN